MRAHDAAMARLCQLVPKHTFVEKYGLLLPDDGSKEPDYKQILTAHACKFLNNYHLFYVYDSTYVVRPCAYVVYVRVNLS